MLRLRIQGKGDRVLVGFVFDRRKSASRRNVDARQKRVVSDQSESDENIDVFDHLNKQQKYFTQDSEESEENET